MIRLIGEGIWDFVYIGFILAIIFVGPIILKLLWARAKKALAEGFRL